jgi:hypothetical protein
MSSLLDDTYCIYCQKEYSTPKRLLSHIKRMHKNTYAYWAYTEAHALIEKLKKEA